MHRRKASTGVFVALALASACHRELTGPLLDRPHPVVTVQVPVRSSGPTFSKLSADNRSRYQCLFVMKHPDGRYRKATGYLHFPAAMLPSTGATRYVSVEWRPDAGATPAGATNCQIPDTPEAETYLKEHLLFIDPKTMHGGESGVRARASLIPSASSHDVWTCCTLPVIVVTAQPGFPYAFYEVGGSGAFGRSWDTTLEHPSIPAWSDPADYTAPGWPCTDGTYDGVYVDAASMTGAANEACPKTGFDSICIDLYIAQCVVAGFTGDCRGADPDATPGASRAQIMFPLDPALKDSATVTISQSCLATPIIPICRSPLDTVYNKVQIAYRGTDTIAVTFSLHNSFEQVGPVTVGPAIDGTVIFVKFAGTYWGVNSPNGWDLYGTYLRDAFPSMSIVRSSDGTNEILIQSDETKVSALIDALHMKDYGTFCTTPFR